MNPTIVLAYTFFMNVIAALEAGRRDFLNATHDISPRQASAKPAPGGWSVLECIEHVITVEDRYLGWIANGVWIEPRPDAKKELRLFTMARSRLTKIQSPESLQPHGRFHSLDAALSEFNAVRDRSVQLAQLRGEALYAIGAKHPRFGNLNAVELLHLIDAHTRRHADQIREIYAIREACQTTSVRMKPLKSKIPAVFKRDSPDLPAEFASTAAPAQLFNDAKFVTIAEHRLQDLDQSRLRIDTFQLDGSVLERVQFSNSQFATAVWKDVRFVGCDLANIHAHRLSLLRVDFVDCRLTGFRATAMECQDVLIQNGDARYAQFQRGKFRSCEFSGCDLTDADLQEADLSGSILRSCNLARADLRKAQLRNTDFRKSEVDSMIVGINDLQGAIVDAPQAMVFARLLGLQIA